VENGGMIGFTTPLAYNFCEDCNHAGRPRRS
jgi:hypothetical protein